MAVYRPALKSLLNALHAFVAVTITDHQDKGEWFLVKSRMASDAELFRRLEGNWRRMVKPNASQFALLHVAGGPESGVWLHYLATPEIAAKYEPGCHRLPSWE